MTSQSNNVRAAIGARARIKHLFLALILVCGLLLAGSVHSSPARELLYSSDDSGPVPEIVARVLSGTDAPQIPDAELELNTGDPWFARLVPRDVVFADGELAQTAVLGTKQFVFATTPEGIQGKSLLEMFFDIGYEARDVFLDQLDLEMVVVLFQPAQEVQVWPATDGNLPADWQKHIYVPTWTNVVSLFEQMAMEAKIDPDHRGEFSPNGTFFRQEATRSFVLNYPLSGKSRIEHTSYDELLAFGGADCTYRKLLEAKLSVFRHFKGNGRTHNQVVFGNRFSDDPSTGLLEFVVPNRLLKDIDKMYIVGLGELDIPGMAIPKRQDVRIDECRGR